MSPYLQEILTILITNVNWVLNQKAKEYIYKYVFDNWYFFIYFLAIFNIYIYIYIYIFFFYVNIFIMYNI